MNLIEQFDTLEIPDNEDRLIFKAASVPNYPHFRVAIDGKGNPVILLSVVNSFKNVSFKNFRLKHLQLTHNVECKITDKNKTTYEQFTVITFTNQDRHLQEYFLRISESLVRSLKTKPTQEQLVDSLKKFIEVFRALSGKPSNTVQGL